MTTNFEIIVGTYEQFLVGYKVEKVDKVSFPCEKTKNKFF